MCSSLLATDYPQEFARIKNGGDEKQVEALLNEWIKSEPSKPDALIAAANYYANKASGVSITTKPAEKGGTEITDPKSGKEVGSITDTVNPEYVAKSVAFLNQALKTFPERIDIWFGLATVQESFGDFKGELATLKDMVVYAKGHSGVLRNYEGKPMTTDPNKLFPEKLHDYATYYYEKNTSEDSEKMLQIANLSAENYPKHTYAFNDIAAYYSGHSDFKTARVYFEKALKADPTDTLVLLNLGDVCLRLNDSKQGRDYYNRVIQLNSKSDDAAAAREALKKMGDK